MKKMNRLRRYVLITPIKNEFANVADLVKCLADQYIPPMLWIVVDDWSNDGSFESLQQWVEKYSWIKVIRTDMARKREIAFHYSKVVKLGFDYFKSLDYEYDYIGVLDADVLLEQDYFENLMEKFEKNPLLGVGSGYVISLVGNRKIWEKEPPEWPCGAARLWSAECFEKTGWQVTMAPDSVSTVKAIASGYETRHFTDLVITHLRPTWSGSGFWYGFIDLGRARYFLGYRPLFVMIASLKYTYDYPHTGTLPFLLGYFSQFFTCKKRIDDTLVIDFFKKRLTMKFKAWLKRILSKAKQK